MNQMTSQMQGMSVNPQIGMQQSYGFPQQQHQFNMAQYKMNPSLNNQLNFTQRSSNQLMYNTNQMNSFNQTVGNNVMMNGSLAANQQNRVGAQPLVTNGMMGNNVNLMGNNMNSGNTMNNQLWN